MSNAIEPGYVVPTPQPVKTLGLLNIVFASILLLFGLFSMISFLMMPTMVKVMQAQQSRIEAQAREQAETRRLADLKGLEVREKAAKTEPEREALARERTAIENRPKPFVPDTTLGLKMVQERSYVNYNWADILTGVPLNIAMIVAGIGLLRLKRWGRTLALWVAGLKLIRIAGLLLATVLVISPHMTRTMSREFDKMGAQIATQQGNNPANAAKVQKVMRTMTQVMGAAITGSYVLFFTLAMIYPGVLLYALNKPGARAALRDRKPGPAHEALT